MIYAAATLVAVVVAADLDYRRQQRARIRAFYGNRIGRSRWDEE